MCAWTKNERMKDTTNETTTSRADEIAKGFAAFYRTCPHAITPESCCPIVFFPGVPGKNNHRQQKEKEKQKKDMKQTIQQQIVTVNQFLSFFGERRWRFQQAGRNRWSSSSWKAWDPWTRWGGDDKERGGAGVGIVVELIFVGFHFGVPRCDPQTALLWFQC